jgi:hypothetical protein
VIEMSDIPRPPAGTKAAGRRLWRAVQDKFELAEHEETLLRQACRVADLCADLQATVDAEGPLTTTRLGETKTHPAVVELRNQRALLARLIVALRVPLGDQEQSTPRTAPIPRVQRRGLRGFQGGAA